MTPLLVSVSFIPCLSLRSRGTFCTFSTPTRSGCLSMKAFESENTDEKETVQLCSGSDDISNAKGLSPLAMAAADWLEEEDDELAMYWDRFDAAKSGTKSITGHEDHEDEDSLPVLSSNEKSTEQLLDGYYQRTREKKRNMHHSYEKQQNLPEKHLQQKMHLKFSNQLDSTCNSIQS